MTGFGKFLLAITVSFLLMIGALGSKHPTFLIALAIGTWIFFVSIISPGLSKKKR